LTISAANQQIIVSWATVPGAASYEVYRSTSATIPASPSATVTTLNHTSTGLTNGTTYYFWVKAVNANGTGDASPMANGKPTRAGLYRNSISDSNKIGTQNLTASLSYISTNAVSGDNYFIIIGTDESVSNFTLDYSGKTIGITLIGEGGEQRIMLNSYGCMFTITGVTLTLDENISLIGRNPNNNSLISVYSNGKLIINDGAKISGNKYDTGNGGGISVGGGGTFTMNGGIINGNTATSYGGGISVGGGNATFIMNGGIISGNTVTENYGGGVYVTSGGAFTMYGGTISGNTSGRGGGGVYVSYGTFKKIPSGGGQNSGIIYGSDAVGNDANGVPLRNTSSNGDGHAVSRVSQQKRNTTAGETDQIDTSTGLGLSASGNPPFGQ